MRLIVLSLIGVFAVWLLIVGVIKYDIYVKNGVPFWTAAASIASQASDENASSCIMLNRRSWRSCGSFSASIRSEASQCYYGRAELIFSVADFLSKRSATVDFAMNADFDQLAKVLREASEMPLGDHPNRGRLGTLESRSADKFRSLSPTLKREIECDGFNVVRVRMK